jgi:hypothetical protein
LNDRIIATLGGLNFVLDRANIPVQPDLSGVGEIVGEAVALMRIESVLFIPTYRPNPV